MTKHYKSTVQSNLMMAQEQELQMVLQECNCFKSFMLLVITLGILAKFGQLSKTFNKTLKSMYSVSPSLPEVSVTIEAHDAERAASRDATFCLERSRVFCFHFSDA